MTASHPDGDPLIGTQLGNFRIDCRIAVGGMGIIYRAEHVVIGRQAAIKVLTEEYSGNNNMIKRLHREARAVNQIGHPNIVDIFDFGRTDDGREYFVMEYLIGQTLARFLADRAPLPWSISRPILIDVLGALGAAHELGIIHRDIKPENILIIGDEQGKFSAKVLDFGIAKSIGTGPLGEQLTQAGAVMGTPEHIAPEQIRGANVDGRADLYALGTILFEMVSGRRPYVADRVMDLLLMHLKQPIPEIPTPQPELGIPAFIRNVLDRALAKNPEERISSARAFADALDLPYNASAKNRGLDSHQLEQVAREHDGKTRDRPLTETSAFDRTTVIGAAPSLSSVRSQKGEPDKWSSAELAAIHPPHGRRLRRALLTATTLAGALGLGYGIVLWRRSATDSAQKPLSTLADGTKQRAELHAPREREALTPKRIATIRFQVQKVIRTHFRSADPNHRRMAAKGFEYLADPDALTLLSETLHNDPDPSVRGAVASALSAIWAPGVEKTLLEARKVSTPDARILIDKALALRGTESGREGLARMLQTQDLPLKWSAALALAEAADRRALPVLESMIQRDIKAPLLIKSLEYLAQFGNQEAKATLRKGSTEASPDLQLLFATSLVRLGDSYALKPLKRIVASETIMLRLSAAAELASLDDDSGVDLVKKYLEDPQAKIRISAAFALGNTSDPSVLTPLFSHLNDRDGGVQAAAAQSLARLLAQLPGERLHRSQGWLLSALRDASEDTGRAAVASSAELDPKLAIELLAWAFNNRNPGVRAAALARLGRLTKQSSRSQTIIRAGLSDRSAQVRRSAALALAHPGQGSEEHTATKKTLADLVHDRSALVGIAAAGALLRLGDTTYLSALRQALRSKKPAIRSAAVGAIGYWNDLKRDALLRKALDDRAPNVRVAAALSLATRGHRKASVGPREQRILMSAILGERPEGDAAMSALLEANALTPDQIKKLSRSKSDRIRSLALRAAPQRLEANQALPILLRATTDSSAQVRRAATRAIAHIARTAGATANAQEFSARYSPQILARLRRLVRDSDSVVRSAALRSIAHFEDPAYKGVGGIVKRAALPAADIPVNKPETPPRTGKTGKRNFKKVHWLEDDGAQRRYKDAISRAAVLESKGRYNRALKLLMRARRKHPQHPILFEIAKMHLKLALSHMKRKPRASAHLKEAQNFFTRYLKLAPKGSLAKKARRGLRDVKRMKAAIR